MASESNDMEMVQLAKRALHHYQHDTTDSAPAIMRMPVAAYTSESRYLAERERIFKHLPLALALTIELPEPGDFKTMSVLDTPLLICRGNDGKVRTFLNVCRHRGAKICTEETGNHKTFSCPYHAWTYNREGALVSRYAPETFGELDHDQLGLTALACEEKCGFIWVILGSRGQFDIDAWLGDFSVQLDSLRLSDWYLYEKRELPGPGWKVTMDGYLEIYHHNVVHGATVGQHTIGNLMVLDTYGPHQRLTLGRKSLGILAEQKEANWRPLEHIRLVHNCFPNLSISGILGDHCLVSQIFPGPTPGETLTVQMILAAKEPVTEEEKAAADAFSRLVLQAVQDEDYRLGSTIQDGISTAANHEFIFGRNEPAVQNYHNWVARFMQQESEIDWSSGS